jgi:hypothetical protein
MDDLRKSRERHKHQLRSISSCTAVPFCCRQQRWELYDAAGEGSLQAQGHTLDLSSQANVNFPNSTRKTIRRFCWHMHSYQCTACICSTSLTIRSSAAAQNKPQPRKKKRPEHPLISRKELTCPATEEFAAAPDCDKDLAVLAWPPGLSTRDRCSLFNVEIFPVSCHMSACIASASLSCV